MVDKGLFRKFSIIWSSEQFWSERSYHAILPSSKLKFRERKLLTQVKKHLPVLPSEHGVASCWHYTLSRVWFFFLLFLWFGLLALFPLFLTFLSLSLLSDPSLLSLLMVMLIKVRWRNCMLRWSPKNHHCFP